MRFQSTLHWIILCCSCVVFFSIHPSEASEKPNFLIIVADDLNKDSLSIYGNNDSKTPHIDELARTGVVFENAFTTTAMCAPTRAQLYTGLYPVRSGAYPNHSRVKDGVTSIVHDLKNLGYRVALNGKTHFKPQKSFPFERIGGGKFNESAIETFVDEVGSTPFCLVMASHSPHVPWKAGNAKMFSANDLEVPEYWLDTPEFRQSMTRYYAEINDLDRELGVCRRIIREAGKDKDTIVIFTTEQGSQMPGCKWTCYETGLNIGLIMNGPKYFKAGKRVQSWVHHIDIRPTMVELAGGIPDHSLDGKSFLPVLTDLTKVHRNVTYGVHTQMGAIGSPKSGYPVRSIRKGPYKLILNLNHAVEYTNALTENDNEEYWESWLNAASSGDSKAQFLVQRYTKRPQVEFYNLSSDPYELQNLAQDELYRNLIASLRGDLLSWMESQGDLGFETEQVAPSRK